MENGIGHLAKIVTIDYAELLNDHADLSAKIEEVCFASSLAAILNTVPEILQRRHNALYNSAALSEMLSWVLQGFGPSGLGIITVSGVPDILRMRKRLLMLIDTFAVRLPPSNGREHAAPNVYLATYPTHLSILTVAILVVLNSASPLNFGPSIPLGKLEMWS